MGINNRAARLYCFHGHRLTEENKMIVSYTINGKEYTRIRCRACAREASRKSHRKQREKV